MCYATSTRHESPSDATTRATTGGRAANADASHTLRWLGKGWEVLCVTGARPSNSQQRLNAWWLVVHASSPTPCATNERETTRRPMRARVCRWKVSPPTNRARGRERRRQQPRARERQEGGREAKEQPRARGGAERTTETREPLLAPAKNTPRKMGPKSNPRLQRTLSCLVYRSNPCGRA